MKDIKLISFDLDGTLIKNNSWLLLNMGLGITAREDLELYDKYSAGELSYEEWIKILLGHYKNSDFANKQGMHEIWKQYEASPHAATVIAQLKKNYEVCIVTGALKNFALLVGQELGIENVCSVNELEFDEKWNLKNIFSLGDEPSAKLRLLQKFCSEQKIELSQVIHVGDGTNDIPIFDATGKGIAFARCSDSVKKHAQWIINDLEDLPLLLESLS